MNEQIDGETYHSFIPTAFGNAIRNASAQVTQALSNVLGANAFGGMSMYDIYIFGNAQIIVRIEQPHPYYDADAPPNTYKLIISPTTAENRQTIKTILQGFMPAAGADTDAAPGAPAGAARRRKSRKGKKSKKVSRRRRSTRRY